MRKTSTKLLVIVITTTAIIAAATTQIQPAYSQASHCRNAFGSSTCVTPGQDPTISINGGPEREITHQDAGRQIGGCHSTAAKAGGLVECTVTHP